MNSLGSQRHAGLIHTGLYLTLVSLTRPDPEPLPWAEIPAWPQPQGVSDAQGWSYHWLHPSLPCSLAGVVECALARPCPGKTLLGEALILPAFVLQSSTSPCGALTVLHLEVCDNSVLQGFALGPLQCTLVTFAGDTKLGCPDTVESRPVIAEKEEWVNGNIMKFNYYKCQVPVKSPWGKKSPCNDTD